MLDRFTVTVVLTVRTALQHAEPSLSDGLSAPLAFVSE
jgi:hypothetical protein